MHSSNATSRWGTSPIRHVAMSVSRLFGIRRRSDTTTPLNRSVVMRSLKLCCRPISGFGANGYRFRALNNTVGHHNAVKFSWEMIDGRGQADSIDRQGFGRPRCSWPYSVGRELLSCGPAGVFHEAAAERLGELTRRVVAAAVRRRGVRPLTMLRVRRGRSMGRSDDGACSWCSESRVRRPLVRSVRGGAARSGW
jgi:hypothetical protein